MKPGRIAIWSAGCLALSLLLAPPLRAQERFLVLPTHIDIPERGLVESYQIIDGTNGFSIIPPLGWRLRVDSAQKQINFVSSNQAVTISLKFAPTNSALVPELDLEALQAGVEERYNAAKVLGHFRGVTGFVPGEAFDVRWHAAGDHVLCTRLVLVPYDGGTIEISLTGPEETLETERRLFGGLLNSLSLRRRNPRP